MKRAILLATLLAVPLLMAGALALHARQNLGSDTTAKVAEDCCPDPSSAPGCCPECQPDCCLATRNSQPSKTADFVCPVTGEILPCPDCCPLNQK
jgi:hypothetical protein